MLTSTSPAAFRAPAPLRPGSHLRVVAPSSPFDPDALERGLARLRTRYRVSHAPDLVARLGFLAGDDARRRRELEEALRDPDVDAIVAARGGYGAMRVAEAIPPSLVAAHPKLLVGLSDITALHALWARAGLGSLHAGMALAVGDYGEAAFARWCAALEGAPTRSVDGLVSRGAAQDTAEGPLLGGNLAVLAAMVGTTLMPDLRGAVLFLEDIGEPVYRLDRMLTQLLLAGALDGVVGVLAGSFTRCTPTPDGFTAEDVLVERLGPLGIPLLTGLPSGHDPEPLELPFGDIARITPRDGLVMFLRAPLASV